MKLPFEEEKMLLTGILSFHILPSIWIMRKVLLCKAFEEALHTKFPLVDHEFLKWAETGVN